MLLIRLKRQKRFKNSCHFVTFLEKKATIDLLDGRSP